MKFKVGNLVVIALAGLIALASARPYAGGFNDSSRLATVESLVDHQTWAIDHSIFSGNAEGGSPALWSPDDPLPEGTGDKLFIKGRFFSDKPPVTAVLMAAVYQVLQWSTGLVARQNPSAFCYLMTLCSSGVAYVIAVWCVYRLAVRSRLALIPTVFLTGSFALATVATAYARQVNASIILLAIAFGLILVLQRVGDGSSPVSGKLAMAAGFLAGFGYSTDLASGPILLVCTSAFLFTQSGYRVQPLVWLGLGALPWLVGHHALNYAIGGTIGPMNMVPEYFHWPNSPFSTKNLTGGGAGPDSFPAFLAYLRGFLVGARGFFCHNFVLLLALPAFFGLIRKSSESRPLLLAFAAWSLGTLLIYAMKSSDYSGVCISVRWLVPTLAAGYLIFAKMLEESPETLGDLAILSLCSLPITLADWWLGPFTNNSLKNLPIWIGLVLTSWLVVFLARSGRLTLGRSLDTLATKPAQDV
jgi:hypothetical protein